MTLSFYGIRLAIPPPTGPYSVGYTEFELINEFQLKPLDSPNKSKQPLMIQLWYPSDISKSRTEYSLHNYIPKGILDLKNLHDFMLGPEKIFRKSATIFLQKLTTFHTHAYENSPIAIPKSDWNPSGLYPILIFRGLPGRPYIHTLLLEELASHGYVCFSLFNPYFHGFVMYRNEALTLPGEFMDLWNQYIEEMQESTTLQEKEEIHQKYFRERSPLELCQQDTLFILERITKGLPPHIQDILENKIDPNQIGLFGHSIGGSVALHMAFQDTRIKAGINIDGGYSAPDFLKKTLEIPFMFFYNTYHIGMNDYWYINSKAPSYSVAIKTKYPWNYTDATILPKFFKEHHLNSISGKRMLFLFHKYTVGFFDRHLKNIKNENTTLLSTVPSPFPEVSFKSERTEIFDNS